MDTARKKLTGFLTATATLALALLLLPSGPTAAAPVTADGASKAARGWLKADAHPLGATLGGAVQRVETFQDQAGLPLYHVVYLAPSGFVIMPAEDSVEPIIAFSSKGRFDPSLTNSLGAMVNQDLPERVAQARALKAAAPGAEALRATGKWRQYQQASEGSGASTNLPANALLLSDLRVAPLLQSQWDQQEAGGEGSGGPACYNYYTPPYTNGSQNNYVCGCVATAMAQLLRYYQYPTVGVGVVSNSYEINGVTYEACLRGGNGTGGAYSWANMPLVPDDTISTAQCQAIGAIAYDAGIAVGMNYGPDGSAADALVSGSALTSFFKYSAAMVGQGTWSGQPITGTSLLAMINPNLDAGNPVLLAIEDANNNGHELVCDGYGYIYSTLYHHLNLGWSGNCDAWYALPNINAGGYDFSIVNICTYNVYTNGSGEIISGRIVTDQGFPVPNAAVTATRTGGGTYTAVTSSNGIYALPRVPSSSTYTLSVSASGFFGATTNVSTGLSVTLSSNSGNVWGANVVLAPVGLDHFQWSVIGPVQAVNTPFLVTLTAQNSTNATVTNFAGKALLTAAGAGAGTATNRALPSGVSPLDTGETWMGSGTMTEGYSFTPTNDLQVFQVRSFEGTNVSIWTANGTLVMSQTVPRAPGAWTTTTLASKVTLSAYNQYIIGVSYSYNDVFYIITSALTAFANGAIGRPLISYNDVYATPTYPDSDFAPVDMVYTVSTPPTISPAVSGNFTNGVWSGYLTVQQICSNVVVTANDGTNHTGLSSSFQVGASVSTALVTVTASPTLGGTVSGGGNFNVGSSQTISATPNSGYQFSQWQDGLAQNPRAVTVPAGGTNCAATFTQSVGSLFFAVNAGSTNAVGAFAADTDYAGGSMGSTTNTIGVSGVTNPAPQAVYQTERNANGVFVYTFTNLIAGNSYFVRLHFAEFRYTAIGQRQFNVSINGTQVLANFDIFASAGTSNKAVVKEFTVEPDSRGRICVGFTNVLDGARLAASRSITCQAMPPP